MIAIKGTEFDNMLHSLYNGLKDVKWHSVNVCYYTYDTSIDSRTHKTYGEERAMYYYAEERLYLLKFSDGTMSLQHGGSPKNALIRHLEKKLNKPVSEI